MKINPILNICFLTGMVMTSCSNDDITPEVYPNDPVYSNNECLRLEGHEITSITASKTSYFTGVDSLGSEITLTIPQGAMILRSVFRKSSNLPIFIIKE
uniref:hypothetical protein n=1 Tax=Antarcticibacterium sp. 1MA-6-2 TaxID=2908210 RepID=UPI001F43F1E5|nr:hypothetical protein [Antarcticibacterium sp. 1MA-6-2]UJH90530.1 hypothetical protein LZ575_17275 [Antarcticibacterium sp. 1MA-6-2]